MKQQRPMVKYAFCIYKLINDHAKSIYLSIYIEENRCVAVNLANAAQWYQHQPIPKSMKGTIAYIDNNACMQIVQYDFFFYFCSNNLQRKTEKDTNDWSSALLFCDTVREFHFLFGSFSVCCQWASNCCCYCLERKKKVIPYININCQLFAH